MHPGTDETHEDAPRSAGSGCERGAEEVEHVLETLLEHLLGERVVVEQPAEERRVGEVAQQRAVPGEQQLLGVVACGTCLASISRAK